MKPTTEKDSALFLKDSYYTKLIKDILANPQLVEVEIPTAAEHVTRGLSYARKWVKRFGFEAVTGADGSLSRLKCNLELDEAVFREECHAQYRGLCGKDVLPAKPDATYKAAMDLAKKRMLDELEGSSGMLHAVTSLAVMNCFSAKFGGATVANEDVGLFRSIVDKLVSFEAVPFFP